MPILTRSTSYSAIGTPPQSPAPRVSDGLSDIMDTSNPLTNSSGETIASGGASRSIPAFEIESSTTEGDNPAAPADNIYNDTGIDGEGGEEVQRDAWGSRFGFILAATGSSVGLGNIWKYPMVAGMYGGGAFTLVYLVCVVMVGLPLMYAEFVIGIRGKSDPVGSLTKLATGEKGRKLGMFTGALAVFATTLILSFYSVIAGWAIFFLVESLGGYPGGEEAIADKLDDLQSANGARFFNSSLLCHTLFMVLTTAIVSFGVQKGIEAACKVLMPVLMLLLLILMILGLNMDGGPTAVSFLFKPRWELLSGNAVLEAVGHAFFTLSLGVGAMITYGSYLDIGDNVGGNVVDAANGERRPLGRGNRSIIVDILAICIMDTGIALVSGVAIFSITFSNCMDAGTGPTLLFATLPVQFVRMTGGTAFGIAFFSLVVFAALTSSVAFLEVVVATVVDRMGLGSISRAKACVGVGVFIWAIGVGVVFSEDLNEFFDTVTTRYFLPIGGLCTAIFAGYCMDEKDMAAGLGGENPERLNLYKIWYYLIRYVTPVMLLVVIVNKFSGEGEEPDITYPRLSSCPMADIRQ